MNTRYIPGPIDLTMAMEGAGVTKTADYNGASKDLGSGYAPGGVGQPIAAVAQITAIDKTNADETYTLQLEESNDDATWTQASAAVPVTEVGTVTVPGYLSSRYCRLKLDVGGTTPSISYVAHLVPIGRLG